MSFQLPEWVLQWNEIVATVGSIILTLFLIILYKRQQEQLAADHKAWLEVSDAEWDGDEATIQLSNFGNGTAANLKLVTLAYIETGEHQEFSIMRNSMKRPNKEGTWANVIQAGEEDVTLTGKSRVGRPGPEDWSRNWIPSPFSQFVLDLKRMDVETVKILPIIQGIELSNSIIYATVYSTPISFNPQNFEQGDSMQNLPSVVVHSNDDTFEPFFRKSSFDKIKRWTYFNGIQLINLVPGVSLQVRVANISGMGLVKTDSLQHKIKQKIPYL